MKCSRLNLSHERLADIVHADVAMHVGVGAPQRGRTAVMSALGRVRSAVMCALRRVRLAGVCVASRVMLGNLSSAFMQQFGINIQF
jgi:hypothetical protein